MLSKSTHRGKTSIAPAEQKKKRTGKAEERNPARGETGEKRMPAMAAARGVFKRARIKVASCFI
jgi:hypothetical protein